MDLGFGEFGKYMAIGLIVVIIIIIGIIVVYFHI